MDLYLCAKNGCKLPFNLGKKIGKECYQILSSMLSLEYAAVVDSMDQQLGKISSPMFYTS